MSLAHIQALTAVAHRRGLGAGAMSSSTTSQQQTRPYPHGVSPPAPVYTGHHAQANATLTQTVWSGQYWIAAGSRVKATTAGSGDGWISAVRASQPTGQTLNVYTVLGQHMPVGPIHVPASSLRLDSVHATRTLHGLPDAAGLGIAGPYGATLDTKGSALDAGLYEVSGTQVSLHDPQMDPSTIAPNVGVIGFFNNQYGDNGGKIVGEPDTVMADGQVANANGYSWAQVAVDGGALNGKAGYVALKYLAPRGWTASHGGTQPNPPVVSAPPLPADEGDSSKPPALMTGGMPSSWTPWIIGLGALALLVGGGVAIFGTRKGKAVRRLGRIKYKKFKKHHAKHRARHHARR